MLTFEKIYEECEEWNILQDDWFYGRVELHESGAEYCFYPHYESPDLLAEDLYVIYRFINKLNLKLDSNSKALY